MYEVRVTPFQSSSRRSHLHDFIELATFASYSIPVGSPIRLGTSEALSLPPGGLVWQGRGCGPPVS